MRRRIPSRAVRPVLVALVAALAAAQPVGATGPQPINLHASGTNGAGRIERPGRSCADGGDGAYWHYEYEAELPPSTSAPVLSKTLETDVGVHLDVHSDLDHGGRGGWLQGRESYVTLTNQRGTVRLRLDDAGGACGAAGSTVSATSVQAQGTWIADPDSGTGSYRNISGSGRFTVDAGIAPGADNPWTLDLNGNVTVLAPSLDVVVVGTSWGNLGADYLLRTATVLVRITNTGPGDSFGAQLTQVTPITSGVVVKSTLPIALGDLASGESVEVPLRFQLGLLTGPCKLVLLGCQFDVRYTTNFPDALDVAGTYQDIARAKAPTLPPPL